MEKQLSAHHVIGFIATLAVATLSTGLRANGNDASMQVIKRYLLSSSSAADTRLVTRTLDFMAPGEQELSDIIAERLYLASDAGVNEDDEDAVAWFAKSLGELGDARYQDAIVYSTKKIKSTKIIRELNSAKRGLTERGSGQYAKGAVDLSAIRQQAQAQLAANRHADDTQLTVDSLMGRSLQEIISQLGMPDHIGSQELYLNGTLIVKARTDAVMAHYFGHGMVVFSWDTERKSWVADKVWFDRGTKNQPYEGPHALFANVLSSADGKYFRVALVRARQTVMADEAMIALLRTRLLASLAETEPHEVAGLEYVCTLLAKRSDPADIATLETVMNEAASDDLRDRAEVWLEQMRGKAQKQKS